jgi:hypothetical protein
MPGVALAVSVWHLTYGAVSNITTDQHTQTLIALGMLVVAVLGGLIHTVYRLGRLTQGVSDVKDRVERVERKVDLLPQRVRRSGL